MITKESSPSPPPRRVSLGVRRAIVLAMYGGYAVAAALGRAASARHAVPLGVASALVLAVTVAGAAAVFYRTGYWMWGFAPDSSLDERQVARRNRVFGYCYTLMYTLVLLALLYDHIAADAHWWLPDRRLDGEWIFWGVTALGMTLPSAMLSWFDQPPPEED